jgi:hypothetical protein
MTTFARAATELRELADRFVALSEAGLQACASSDDVALSSALDARDLVSARFAVVSGQVAALRRALPLEQRTRADAALEPVTRAVQQASAINAVLLQRASDVRVDIGRQLDLLRRDHEATSAYHHAPGAASTRPADMAPRWSDDGVSSRDTAMLAEVMRALKGEVDPEVGQPELTPAEVEDFVSHAVANVHKLEGLSIPQGGIAPVLGAGVLQELLRQRKGGMGRLPAEPTKVDTKR